jgi:Ca2+-binding RTX toxin-like protein
VHALVSKALIAAAALALSTPLLAHAGGTGSSGSDQPGSVHGTDHHDVMIGGPKRDLFHGENGDDLIKTGGGPDWINGGRDDDTLFGGPGDDVVFDPSVWEQGHQLVPGRDRMHGGSGVETMYLGQGDIVWAGSGGDRILSTHAYGGVVYCGRGHDTVYYSRPRPALHDCESIHRVKDPTYKGPARHRSTLR